MTSWPGRRRPSCVWAGPLLFWASGIHLSIEETGVSSYLQLWLQGLCCGKTSMGEILDKGSPSPGVPGDLVCDRETRAPCLWATARSELSVCESDSQCGEARECPTSKKDHGRRCVRDSLHMRGTLNILGEGPRLRSHTVCIRVQAAPRLRV